MLQRSGYDLLVTIFRSSPFVSVEARCSSALVQGFSHCRSTRRNSIPVFALCGRYAAGTQYSRQTRRVPGAQLNGERTNAFGKQSKPEVTNCAESAAGELR